jgi:hypothetical protein
MQAAIYEALLQALLQASSCGDTDGQRQSHAAVALATAYVLLLHCSQVLPDKKARAQHTLGPENACSTLTILLHRQMYQSPTLSTQEATLVADVHAQHKAYKVVPQVRRRNVCMSTAARAVKSTTLRYEQLARGMAICMSVAASRSACGARKPGCVGHF